MTSLLLSMRVVLAFFDSSRIDSAVSCVIVHKTLDPSCMSNCSAVCSGRIRTELKMNVQHASVWIQRAQYASIILRIGVVRRILKKTDGGVQFPSTRMITMLPEYIYSSVRSTCRPQQPPGHAAAARKTGDWADAGPNRRPCQGPGSGIFLAVVKTQQTGGVGLVLEGENLLSASCTADAIAARPTAHPRVPPARQPHPLWTSS